MIDYFINQFNVNMGWIISRLDGEGNQRVALTTTVNLIKECENLTNIQLVKIVVEQKLKQAYYLKNGWRVYNKDITVLTYKTALDVVLSLLRKSGKL